MSNAYKAYCTVVALLPYCVYLAQGSLTLGYTDIPIYDIPISVAIASLRPPACRRCRMLYADAAVCSTQTRGECSESAKGVLRACLERESAVEE
jgi:hypothetical protein